MNAMTALQELPCPETARLPAVYERATQALAECTRIDECQSWADKAEAMASYARQAHDHTLHKMADRIQARAIRRCGELLKQIQPAKNQHDAADRAYVGNDISRSQAAKDAGLSERQKVTALRVANVPAQDFESLVESDSPPTVTKLSDLGKKPKVVPLYNLEGIDPEAFKMATGAGGAIRRLAEFCKDHEPAIVACGFKQHEKQEIREMICTIESWLYKLSSSLWD